MQKPEYHELVDALTGMACQYLQRDDGTLDDDAVSAGEIGIDVLSRLGLIRDGKLINEAFNFDWMKAAFGVVVSPSALREALSAYLSTLDQRPQYQDGIQMSDAEIAEREIGAFIAWLENQEQQKSVRP